MRVDASKVLKTRLKAPASGVGFDLIHYLIKLKLQSGGTYSKTPKISPSKNKPPKPVTQKPSVKSPFQI